MPSLPHIEVADDYKGMSSYVADRILQLVDKKPDAVLGGATGSTPIGVYEILSRSGADFSHTRWFNLDEYYGLPRSPKQSHHPLSYHQFMEDHLFGNISVAKWQVPDGQPRSPQRIEEDCRNYEGMIRDAGGIDLQLLGIGRTGHVGFNEPPASADSRTRIINLHDVTRRDAAKDFGGLENVPKQAITMGIGTIYEAHTVILMASGLGKAPVIARALTEPPNANLPATFLRNHPSIEFCLDRDAASLLGPEFAPRRIARVQEQQALRQAM